MSWGGPGFVIAMIAISTAGIVLNNWIRARHGYAPTDEWGTVATGDHPEATRRITLLTNENEALHGKVGRLEERIAVLERIATDPATRISREIDALR